MDGSAGGEIPEGDGADLVVVVPIIKELLDVVLAGEVLGIAGIVEFQDVHAADEEGLDGSLVAGRGDTVGLPGEVQLAGLVVELLGKQEDVLVEIQFLLLELGMFSAMRTCPLRLPQSRIGIDSPTETTSWSLDSL